MQVLRGTSFNDAYHSTNSSRSACAKARETTRTNPIGQAVSRELAVTEMKVAYWKTDLNTLAG